MSKISNNNTKFYCLVYLTQMSVVPINEYLEFTLKFFFNLFAAYTSENMSDEYNKHLSLIVKRINTICKFCNDKVNFL
jgi:hypothetical protein